MNLLDLAELKSRPAKRSRETKLLKKLESLLSERLTVRELVTSLKLQPWVDGVEYSHGSVWIIMGMGESAQMFQVNFIAGTVLSIARVANGAIVSPAEAVPAELEDAVGRAIQSEIEEGTGIKNVFIRPRGVVIEFDEAKYSPDLVAGVLTKVAKVWADSAD